MVIPARASLARIFDDGGEAIGWSAAKESFNHGTLGIPRKKSSIVRIPFNFLRGGGTAAKAALPISR